MRLAERCRPPRTPLAVLALVTLLGAAPTAWAGDNTVPIAFPQSTMTFQNVGLDIVLQAEDIDDDALSFEIVDAPANGTLSGDPPTVRYTPDTDYAGADAFSFRVNDGQADSTPAVVSIVVEEDFNDPPVALSQAVVTTLDAPIDITLQATDEEGDDLTFTVVTPPVHGALTGVAPNLTYTPENGYEGTDTFLFVANDGENDSGPATVFVDIGVVNGLPVAFGQNVVTDVNTEVALELTGQDPEAGDLTFRVTVPPEHGTISGQPPNLTYTPETDYLGVDAVFFVANDGIDDSAPAVISIVVGRNATPVADNLNFDTDLNVAVSIELTGTDDDGDELEFSIAGEPSNGTLSGDVPNLVYTPAQDFSGVDQFQYVASDGQTVSNVATVTLRVAVENIAPFGVSREITTPADEPLAILLEGADPEGAELQFTVLDGPEHGDLSGQAPSVLYAPDQGYNGRDSFTFTVSDGELTSEPATIDLIVGSLNQVPAALDIDVETDVDAAVPVALRGLDGDGDELTYTLVTTPTSGELTGVAPNLTYTPNNGFEGIDIFTYTVSDGLADSEIGVVNIRVGEPNLPPLANSITVSTDVDAAVDVSLDGVDPEGRGLTYQVNIQPFNGTVTGDGQTVTYTPANGFQGIDFFSYVVNDGVQDSEAGLVRVRVGIENEAPQADPKFVQVDEDSVVGFVLTASDPDGDEVEWTLLSQPIRGTLEGEPPVLRYTPPANFKGLDNFDFQVSDGFLNSNIATVVIEVLSVNDLPVTADSVVTTTEDTPVSFALTANDPDGDNLTFEVVTAPSRGALSGEAPNLTYTPEDGFSGEDSLVYVASDAEGSSAETTVRILVDAVNEAPSAADVTGSTDEDVELALTLDGTDPDGDDLQYVITQSPEHGVVLGEGPEVVYVPAAEYSGGDTFRYLVSDGRLLSGEAEVAITINRVEDPPEAVDTLVYTDEGVEVPAPLVAFDPDSEELTYAVVQGPADGTLEGDAPDLIYVPNEGFAGEDSFTWTASDGETTSNVATLRIRVFPEDQENVAPTATGAQWSTDEDVPVEVQLEGDDFNGDNLVYTVVEQPGRGQLTGQAPELVYIPQPNSSGDDFFTFTVSDGEFTSDPATVGISVAPVNDPPIVFPLLINTNQGRPVSFSVVGDDPEQAPLIFEIVEPPEHGELSGVLPELTYTPDDAFFGDDTLVVRASDGQLDSDEATITLRVRRSNNTPPTADDLAVAVDEDGELDFEVTGADADGDLIVYILQALPEHGNLTGNAPNLHYEPESNFFGEDTLTFLVNDGTQNSTVATVTVTINPVNDPPVAGDVSATTQAETAVEIALRADDVDGDDLTFRVSTAPGNGAATVTGATATYTPEDGFEGTDTFVVTVSDGDLEDTASVTVEVFGGEPAAPVVSIFNLPAWLPEPTRLTGAVSDGACRTPPSVTVSPVESSVTVEAQDGQWAFASEDLPTGAHTLTVAAVSDCTGRTGRATITLGVDGDAPQLAVSGLPQSDVDPEDVSTWPSVDPAQPLLLNIQASDGGSGLAEVDADAVDEQGDSMTNLRHTAIEIRSGLPPGGLATFRGAACDGGEFCNGDSFDVGAMGVQAIEITITARDVVGNTAQHVLRLRARGLRDTIVALRDDAFAQFTESAPALAYLDAAVAQLDAALGQLDAGAFSNVLVNLMQAMGDLDAANRFDDAAAFESQRLEVASLVRRHVDETYRQAVADLGQPQPLAASFLARADSRLRAANDNDALLELANAWLWIALGRSAPSVDTPEGILASFEALLADLESYGDTPAAPSAATVAATADQLAALGPVLAAYVQNPVVTVGDAHLAATALAAVTTLLEPLVIEGVWNRQWLAELALLSHAIHAVLIETAAEDLGQDNALVEEATSRIEAGAALWSEGRPDALRGQNRDLLCVAAAMDQVTSQSVEDVPDRCCRLLDAWTELEPRLATPPNCR
jgi:hypothetical protein